MQKWDKRFIELARSVGQWSKDPNRKVGAVIVRDRKILSTGYNGFPAGFPDTETTLSAKDKNTYMVHAEANAIANAHGDLRGATIYVAGLHPCSQCAALITQAGIERVVYDFDCDASSDWAPSMKAAKVIFEQCRVKTECIMPRVIMIGGKKGSGKSWLADQLGYRITSFAAVPKLVFRRIFDVDFDAVKNNPTKTFNGLTARQFMQKFATDAMQSCFSKDLWYRCMIEGILPECKDAGDDVVVISDWRFKHEIIPGAIKIYVLGDDDGDTHPSENSIGPDDADLVLDNRNHILGVDAVVDLLAHFR